MKKGEIKLEEKLKFYDEEHKLFYMGKVAELEKLNCNDNYYRALVYVLSMSPETRKKFRQIFNMKDGEINIDVLQENIWLENDSKKIIRLAFNLFNGCIYDSLKSAEGKEASLNYGINTIFASKYAKYFVEAIKIKYPDYFKNYQANKIIGIDIKNNENSNEKYGLYIRIGNVENESLAIIEFEERKEELLNYCKENNINISGIYADIGYSGRLNEDRKALGKIVDEVNNEKLDGIIARNLDNLVRDEFNAIKLFLNTIKGKVIVGGEVLKDKTPIERVQKSYEEILKEERAKKIKIGKEVKKRQRESR